MNCSIFLSFIFVGSILYPQELKWPTNAGDAYSSNFGEYRDDHFHMGLDIKTNGRTGYEVYAIENGFISRIVSNYNGGTFQNGDLMFGYDNGDDKLIYPCLSKMLWICGVSTISSVKLPNLVDEPAAIIITFIFILNFS